MAAFYATALGMETLAGDAHHSRLRCSGFELIIHQVPRNVAATIVIERPPKRRVASAIRLDFPVKSVTDSRNTARALGGDIDDTPPPWADRDANFFFGYDPEGNQFGVNEQA